MQPPRETDSPLEEGTAPPSSGWPFDRIGLLLGPLLMLGWLSLVERGSLTVEAHRLSAILLLTITWWLTEPIPIPVTGLLSVSLCVLMGAIPQTEPNGLEAARAALAPFAHPSVFFLLGGLFIGRAMTRHGLDRRLALGVLCTRWAGRSPLTVLAAVGMSVMFISMWISNTAATAMMYPVVLGMISVLAAGTGNQNGGFARSPYASGLLLMTAYASSIGGIATPIGTATNVVAMGYLESRDYLGSQVDFFRWTLAGVPMTLAIFAGVFWWLRVQSPAAGLDMLSLRDYLHDEQSRLGSWKRGEINTLIVFLTAVTFWIAPGVVGLLSLKEAERFFVQRVPEEIVAVLVPVSLYLLPVDWNRRKFSLEVSDLLKVDWGTMLLFGAGLSLGNLMFKTGLADTLGHTLFYGLGTSDMWIITAVAIAAAIVLSEFTSNVAAVSTLLPVVLAVCKSGDIDPIPPLMGTTFAASFGSALPVSTMPNAIVYGSGLLPLRRMIVAGIGMDLVCGVVIWIVLRVAHTLHWTPLAG